MASNRQTFHVPSPEEISPDPYEQVIWYDALPLPAEPTVEREVLRPMGAQASINARRPAASGKKVANKPEPLTRNWAQGIVAMEALGAPRSRRPWRPR